MDRPRAGGPLGAVLHWQHHCGLQSRHTCLERRRFDQIVGITELTITPSLNV